jgi:hypothetical protein
LYVVRGKHKELLGARADEVSWAVVKKRIWRHGMNQWLVKQVDEALRGGLKQIAIEIWARAEEQKTKQWDE